VSTATEILLVAGMLNLVVGAASGVPMGLLRQRGEESVPRYLTMVHLGGLMQGPILLAVGFAMSVSELTPWLDTTAAGLLAFGSLLLIVKDTLNWRQGVRDEFAERSTGLAIGNVFAPVHLVGLVLATVAVLSGI
jgi:hypothetical protein